MFHDEDSYLTATYGPDSDGCPCCEGGIGDLCNQCAAEVARDMAEIDLANALKILSAPF